MPSSAAISFNGMLFFRRHVLNAFAKLVRMSQCNGASGFFTTMEISQALSFRQFARDGIGRIVAKQPVTVSGRICLPTDIFRA